MGEWRMRVLDSEWRVQKEADTNDLPSRAIYWLETKVSEDKWERFGKIDMDCAGEGVGYDVALKIVDDHNWSLTKAAHSKALRAMAIRIMAGS